jgi:pyruvate/2-oxoglutarate dehydrogenase complex dihydrolipoamide acyltransferase (E2) component
MNGGTHQAPIARERRHTLHFLDEVRGFSPVFLDTDVDMTRVRAHRAAAREEGRPYSTLTYILHTAARVLAAHPAANAAIRGHLRPRVATYDSVHGKITLDKAVNGQRVVLSAVLRDLEHAELDDIQPQVDHLRAGDPADMPEFAGARLLQRLPGPLGSVAFRLGVRPLTRRAETMGTFAVTSLGHRPVDGFYSVGGTTITLGIGRTLERPVARDGRVIIAPTMRLTMTFDHRVIDGAEAADVLMEIKDGLESFQSVEDHAERPAMPADARGANR